MALPDTHGRLGSDSREGPLVFLFNGDADGLLAQHILGMTLGLPDLRLTGLKRDIQLLKKLPSLDSGRIHVMDVSLAQNRDALPALLAKEGIRISWYDHHDPGETLGNDRLQLHINQAPGICTAAIVHAICGRKHPLWAAMAAFGDNLPVTGDGLASEGGASAAETEMLRRCGILLNYNAYGTNLGDVCFDPAILAPRISTFGSALDFCRDQSLFGPLLEQFSSDRAYFEGLPALVDHPFARAFVVPDMGWARRYAATWANETILSEPHRALAMLHPRPQGGYTVSIRAPRDRKVQSPSAAVLAAEFPTGGGRKLAAGINVLSNEDFERFLARFQVFFGKGA